MKLSAKRLLKWANSKRIPPVLFVAELLLFIVMFRYMFSFTHSTYPYSPEWLIRPWTIVSIVFSVVMCVLTIDSMFGIVSARPPSWRKVVRSSVLLFLSNVVYTIAYYTNFFNEYMAAAVMFIPNWLALIIMIAVLIIMFLPSVRRYYTPPMVDVPPAKEWLKFVFFTPLFKVDSYKLVYKDDRVPEQETSSDTSE